jgi:hypothetical protein
MPPQQGVRRHDRGDLTQGRTADSVRSRGQPTTIVVRQTQSTSAKLTPEKSVLFGQDEFEVGRLPTKPAVFEREQRAEFVDIASGDRHRRLRDVQEGSRVLGSNQKQSSRRA